MACSCVVFFFFFFFQAEDGIRDLVRSRGLGDVYKRQGEGGAIGAECFGIEFIECHWGSMIDSGETSFPARIAVGAGSLVLVRSHDMTLRAFVDPQASVKLSLIHI